MTMGQTAVTPFAELYPFAPFEAIADAAWWRSSDFTSPRGGEFDHAQYQVALKADAADKIRLDDHKAQFEIAVSVHLRNLIAAGVLTPISGIAGRDIGPATAWNDMLAGKPADHQRRWLLQSFDRVFVDEFMRMDDARYSRKQEAGYVPGTHVAPEPEMVLKAWTNICARMDEGTSEEYVNGLSIEAQDRKTGDRCEIHFKGWKPTLMRRNDVHRLEPALDVAKAALVTADFGVATGRLMLTDFLRVDGFREGTDFSDDEEYRDFDLNSTKGRDARISAHAKTHDIGYTQTTNTSVAIHRNPQTGMLMITDRWGSDAKGDEMPEDANGVAIVAGWTSVDSFSCDVWRVMAFDRSTALARMADGGCADPEPVLDAYLASSDAYARNVVRIDVEPGRWRIHAGDDFSKRVNRRKFGIPEGVQVWRLLERVGGTETPDV